MRFVKCLKHAFSMVLHSKLRSWLTILGIVIGVASVIAIISIGEGMQQSLNNRLSGLGGDILTVTAGFSRGGSMLQQHHGGAGGGPQTSMDQATEEKIILGRTDLQALKGIPDIELIDVKISGQVEVSYLGKSGTVSLTGVDQKVWSKITTLKIKEGRMLDSADQNVVVIGGRLAKSYFSQPISINKMITIENSAFRVVGILDDESNGIYMPIQMAYQIVDNKENEVYDSIIIKIRNEEDLDNVIEKIEQKLMNVRHVTPTTKDFSVSSTKQMMEARAQTMSAVNTFLVAIAAISLLVGAVGIANTMFTSVLEKTKEIGIMKSIGAKNKDIMMIFLLNAAFIGLIGGIIGVFFGIMLSGIMPLFLGDYSLLTGGTLVSTNSIMMALSVSIIVGILAGVIPAYQASKLKPVDALRYE
ncbi:MAG: ABC transporter permease [Candidatus Woesearchaeota archaeon]